MNNGRWRHHVVEKNYRLIDPVALAKQSLT